MVDEIANYVDKLIKEYFGKASDIFDNANKYLSPTGLFNYILEDSVKTIASKYLPKRVYEAHVSGYIYVHKLPQSLFIPYCCGHSIKRFLLKGLITPTIYSKPAKHFETFVDHVYNYLSSMQQYFSGAQSLNAVELYSGVFINKDGLDYKSVEQSIQRLLFNLNFPSRMSLQTPFTNFTFVLDASSRLLYDEKGVCGGIETEPLVNYLDEAVLFLKAISENFMKGDGRGLSFTFPITTLMTTSKLIFEDPELYEIVFNTASVKGSFYWLNTRVVNPDTSFAMCCRINIDREYLVKLREYSKNKYVLARKDLEEIRENIVKKIESIRTGGLWCIPDITGSTGVITINLPRLAYESKGEENVFIERLDSILNIVYEGLDWFRKRYVDLASNYRDVYSMPLEYIPEVFQYESSPFFSTIGIIGLPEAIAILMNEPGLWKIPLTNRFKEAVSLMEKTLRYIVLKLREWSIETGIPFNLEEVPGETAGIKLAMMDLKKYPGIGEFIVSDKTFFYSSSIVPYYADVDLSTRIEIESSLQKFFTGGVIMHIFLNEQPDPDGLAKLTKRLSENTDLIYWSYTPAITYCKRCEKTYTGFYTNCPVCYSSEVEIWSRVIGYYRPLSNWYPYRRLEFYTRIHYSL